MQYEAPPRRSSAGTVLIILFLVGFAFLIALVVAGVGALMFTRARVSQQEFRAVAAMQQAEAARMRVQAELQQRMLAAPGEAQPYQSGPVTLVPQDQPIIPPATPPLSTMPVEANLGGTPPSYASELAVPAELPAITSSIRIANREMSVQLDAEGKIQVDGAACELAQLKETLQKAGEGRQDDLVLVVKADKQCRFEHVAAVLAVCKELNLPHVRISAVDN
jgi:biopolymer transport protein ExbD